mmetsp:Transcript_12507/g.36289  ORF Transcript_12507/g.36289 Transcript_12507/m.36289 type:complete len:280 (-) Transcript_12507:242-1081(-)
MQLMMRQCRERLLIIVASHHLVRCRHAMMILSGHSIVHVHRRTTRRHMLSGAGVWALHRVVVGGEAVQVMVRRHARALNSSGRWGRGRGRGAGRHSSSSLGAFGWAPVSGLGGAPFALAAPFGLPLGLFLARRLSHSRRLCLRSTTRPATRRCLLLGKLHFLGRLPSACLLAVVPQMADEAPDGGVAQHVCAEGDLPRRHNVRSEWVGDDPPGRRSATTPAQLDVIGQPAHSDGLGVEVLDGAPVGQAMEVQCRPLAGPQSHAALLPMQGHHDGITRGA